MTEPVRVIRTSNGYAFHDPKPMISSKSEKPTRTRDQVFILPGSEKLEAGLAKLGAFVIASTIQESGGGLAGRQLFSTPLTRRE